VGLAKLSTVVAGIRRDRGEATTLLLDSGDTIQGNPLAYYYASIERPSATSPHPMAVAMNAMRYDAAAIGNHEFNFGLDVLSRYRDQLDFPLLAANALDWTSDAPAFASYRLREVSVAHAPPVIVGIVGLVTPGCAIWDRANVDGRVRFEGVVETARSVIPAVKAAGADVIMVCCHSGADVSSSYGDALPWPENASGLLAEQVPGINAILVGHAHAEMAQRYIVNATTGAPVLLSEPSAYGMRLSVMDLALRHDGTSWTVESATSQLIDPSAAEEDPTIVDLVRAQHATVRHYVNSVIGTSTSAQSSATARYEQTPVLDWVNLVQASALQQGIAGGPYGDLPVLSVSSPFTRSAAIPAGPLSIRDIAGLYNFDNVLVGIELTGAQLRAYLEHSARYFTGVDSADEPVLAAGLTNAPTATAPQGTADYNYDIVSGLTAPLDYEIDLAAELGNRIRLLRYGGSPVTDDQRFAVAINNYRQSGGGNYPAVRSAPVLWDEKREIRQLLLDWVSTVGSLDPGTAHGGTWKLVARGLPLTVSD
jgi:2',3'-cyclic-nucleotide 2'-phosphodiesterase/3'-nucleotidase